MTYEPTPAEHIEVGRAALLARWPEWPYQTACQGDHEACSHPLWPDLAPVAREVARALLDARDPDAPRPFALQRGEDATGVSGTGRVAYGTRFADGTTVIRWTGDRPSTVVWADLETAMSVHGHDGRTRVVWL